MVELRIHEELAERLESIARQENRPVEAVLESLVDLYIARPTPDQSREEARAAMAGMFDEDISDLSTTIRETMAEYYRKRYGSSD